jgi:alpha-N-arabinofuranosidase
VNTDPDKNVDIACDINGKNAVKSVTGQILTSPDLRDHNTFDHPDKLQIKAFNGAKVTKSGLEVKLPSKSIVVLELN